MNPPTKSMTILLNDKERALSEETTVQELLRELGLVEKRGIAVALNNEVVSRPAWMGRTLKQGDCVLIIQATQGG